MNSADQLLVHMPFFIKHVPQKHMPFYDLCMVPVPVDADTMQVIVMTQYIHVQYMYIAQSLCLYVPLIEPQLQLCMQKGVVTYCKKVHLLRHRFEHMCSSAIYYDVDFVTKHCTVNQNTQ